MKVAICSDLHLEFGGQLPNLIVDADVLILAGDVCESRKLQRYTDLLQEISEHYRYILYVAGNHEAYGSEFNKSKALIREIVAPYGNIIFLDNELFTIDDVVFGGCTLWSYIPPMQEWFARQGMNDYRAIKYKADTGYRRLLPKDTVLDHSQSVIWLNLNLDKIDVMISHHLPSYNSVPEQFKDSDLNCCYASSLENQLFNKQLWVHGHTHDKQDYVLNGCRVVCNPRGYKGYELIADNFSVQVVEIKNHLLNCKN